MKYVTKLDLMQLPDGGRNPYFRWMLKTYSYYPEDYENSTELAEACCEAYDISGEPDEIYFGAYLVFKENGEQK